jgi:hypothetical protein
MYSTERTKITKHWWYRYETLLFYEAYDIIATIKSRTRLGAILSITVRKKLH